MATAAAVLVWRLWGGTPTSQSRPHAAPVEDVERAGLSTTLPSASLKGSSKAQVVVIEFADFQCPYCGRHARNTFASIDEHFIATGKIRYAYRHLPLERQHPLALQAALAADCAARQGAFWPMHEFLYANQTTLADTPWLRSSPSLGVDPKLLASCVARADESVIRSDQAEAVRLGINSTPTFFIGTLNGDGRAQLVTRINGAVPYDTFRETLDRIVRRRV
jgi:protein-disulfide isomerase